MILDLLIETVIVLNNYVFGSQHELCNMIFIYFNINLINSSCIEILA